MALALAAFVGIELAGRRYSALMPVQWQVERVAIDYPFTIVPDPDLGFSMPPRQHEVIRTRDYTFLFETDSNGYPNRDPWPENPSLVFLGDSLITGAGVGLDASFTALIARMLPRESVLNLGLPGAGPERQARVYRRFGSDWHPDFVVSCLFLSSDVENDIHFLSWLRDGQGTDYNTYRLQLARAGHRKGIVQRVLDKSLVLDRATRLFRRWIGRGDDVDNRFRFADGSETLFGRYALQFVTRPAAADDPRLDAFVESMEQLRALVEHDDTQLLVVLIPSKEELFGPAAAATRANLSSRVKARLAAMSLPVLDLYPALQRRGAAHTPYYTRDIHLNAYGNRTVAEEFAGWFDRIRRIRPPRNAALERSRKTLARGPETKTLQGTAPASASEGR